MEQFKQTVTEVLAEPVPLSEEQVGNILAVPPKHITGDLGFPCFALAPVFKSTPKVLKQYSRYKRGTKNESLRPSSS